MIIVKALRSLLFLCCLSLLLHACAAPPKQQAALRKIDATSAPQFIDDLQLDKLLTATIRHLHYLNTLPNNTSFSLGADTYPVSWLRESMNSFIDILKQEPDAEELSRIIAENFTVYQAAGRDGFLPGEMLITGYYEPLLHGSLTKKVPFIHPLYAPPDSLVQVRNQQSGKRLFKRRDDQGNLLSYWTRKEIGEQNIAAGSELVYLDSPVDAFILHVQGSGKIQLEDGTVRSIHYAADNGLEYFSIGKLLVDQNKLSLEEVSIPTIREYLRNHPEEQESILNHNIKFIFFNWAADGEPVGSLGEPLTAGRSIAIDPDTLPRETFAFLVTRKPVIDAAGKISSWRRMQRFVLPQDSGAAIQGAGRADLFWGNGEYAKQAAGNMKEKGALYFLIKNNFEEHKENPAEE